ncbi:MAG: zf-HC2 domain-containing protein [Ignavibacteriales bacterium]|nr:zf-HC2 domain-containing protein [Ignavibacteriales bacterium]
MECDRYRELANLFLDGSLDTHIQIELFKHITGCSECQSYIDIMTKMNTIKEREEIKYPSAIDDKLFQRLAEHRVQSSKRKLSESGLFNFFKKKVVLSLPLAAAIIIIAILGGIYFGTSLNKSTNENMVLTLQQRQAVQPSTVIFFYELPPVEVIGKPVLKNARYNPNYQQ